MDVACAAEANASAAAAKALCYECQKITLLLITGELPSWTSEAGQALQKQFTGACFSLARLCAARHAYPARSCPVLAACAAGARTALAVRCRDTSACESAV